MTPPLFRATRPVELRPYQLAALDQLDHAVRHGARAPLVVMPTGGGKTVVAAELIRRTLAKDGTALFLAPRRELVHQTVDKLVALEIEPGVLLAHADERAGLGAAVQVASIDTVLARVVRHRTVELPSFSLVVVDEAHLSITTVRRDLLARWPAALRVGLTATPTRKDGRAIGLLYDTLIEPATPAALTQAGYLVPARYFSWPPPDLRGVRVTAGDYNLQDLTAAMDRRELLGDIVSTWCAHAGDRRTVAFCVSVAHAIGLAEAFRRIGVAAEHVDCKTPHAARAGIFARFAAGTTQVLTNCFVAAYGFDLPVMSCIVLARSTRSLMLYLQMLGRGLRIAPGKSDCLVLDHAGGVHRFGFVTDSRRWTLEGRYALEPTPRSAKPPREPKECPACHAVFQGTRVCPECGCVLRPAGKLVATIDGILVEIGAGEEPETQERQVFYLELRGYASERSYKAGWAAHKYRERHGSFPPWSWNDSPPLTPSPTTLRWIKSRQIAFARSGRAA
jgi:DNA repair protein RadD